MFVHEQAEFRIFYRFQFDVKLIDTISFSIRTQINTFKVIFNI